MASLRRLLLVLALLMVPLAASRSQQAVTPQAAGDFKKDGVAFLEKHCIHCHGDKVQKADLKLSIYRDEAALLKNRKVWDNVLTMLKSGEMPPKSRPRPAMAEVEAFVK